MDWICPQCNENNSGDSVRCACGFDPNYTSAESTENKIEVEREGSENTMSTFAVISMVTAILLFIIGLVMETTVRGTYNIGLLNIRNNLIIVSLVVFAIGVFLFVMAGKSKKAIASEKRIDSVSPDIVDSKECPMCAETVKTKALACRFCGHNFA